MFWKNKKQQAQLSVDEEFFLRQKKSALKNRTKRACLDTTDYEQHLMNFLFRNRNNQKLIIEVANYRNNLLETTDLTDRQIAKQTHEAFKH